MEKGYYPLFRRIQKHWLWKDKPFSKGQAWIDLLLRVNNTDETIDVPLGNCVFKIEPGQFILAVDELPGLWGWGEKKVRLFLERLELEEMILKRGTKKGTIFTVVNQRDYKDWVTPKGERGANKGRDKRDKRDTLNNNKAVEKIESEINPFWILDNKTAQIGLDEKMTDKTVRNEFKRFINHHEVKKTVSEDWLGSWKGWVLNWVKFGSKQVSETGAEGNQNKSGLSGQAYRCWNQTYGNCNPFKTGVIENEICNFCPGMKNRG